MKLKQVTIENYRGIGRLHLPLDPKLTVLYGDNAHGKTSVLSAIAVGLGSIPRLLPNVSSVDFLETDRRGTNPIRIEIDTLEGISWGRQRHGTRQSIGLTKLRRRMEEIIKADKERQAPIDLPIVAFYDTDRAVFDVPKRRRGFEKFFLRYAALEGALSARTNFRDFFKWFYERENEELRFQRDLSPAKYGFKDLEIVTDAIEKMLPGVHHPRIMLRPLRFVVSVDDGKGQYETLSINQLSGGYRIMLALAADLARRMMQGNPHLDHPLMSESVVLIDEIELHLHPSWQQRVLTDLTRTFPETQFIVSTHSPQVLTTIRPEQIVELNRADGEIVAGRPFGHTTYGAEAGYVLNTVMGVTERPAGNEFVQALNEYRALVINGKGESESAAELRQKLARLSPQDPELDRFDIEISRQKILNNIKESM